MSFAKTRGPGCLRATFQISVLRCPACGLGQLAADGGLDVADALHLVLSGKCSEMMTFDERFVVRAGREKARPEVGLAGE